MRSPWHAGGPTSVLTFRAVSLPLSTFPSFSLVYFEFPSFSPLSSVVCITINTLSPSLFSSPGDSEENPSCISSLLFSLQPLQRSPSGRERREERKKAGILAKISVAGMAISRLPFRTFLAVALVFGFVLPAFRAQSFAPAPLPTSDGTSIDQGIAYVLMLVALVLTYIIHTVDSPPLYSLF